MTIAMESGHAKTRLEKNLISHVGRVLRECFGAVALPHVTLCII